jgi:hypothetical protein
VNADHDGRLARRVRPGAAFGWLLALAVAACSEVVPLPPLPPLELQVRNSGLPGGYVWLSIVDQPTQGRWHTFGRAEFICVTCPMPFVGTGTGYEIAVLDDSCAVRARHRPAGGRLLVEIDPGPAIRLIDAPPLADWMPADSSPADPATIPCARP